LSRQIPFIFGTDLKKTRYTQANCQGTEMNCYLSKRVKMPITNWQKIIAILTHAGSVSRIYKEFQSMKKKTEKMGER
jgi:hypothetical protein